MKRIGWLDGARAYAIAGVVLVHAANMVPNLNGALKHATSFGQYGVQLFFIISSITVFITLPHEGTIRDRTSWLVRRYFRIAPLYYIAIGAYAVLDFVKIKLGAHIPLERFTPAAILSNITFLHAIYQPGNNTVVPGGWSIGVEMVFYAFAAIVIPKINKYKLSSAIIIALCAIQLCISYAIFGNVSNNSFGYFWLFTQLPVLLLGTLLCLQIKIVEPHAHWRTGTVLFIAGLVPGAFCGPIAGAAHLLAPILFGVCFCGLLLLASSVWRKAFDNRFAIWIGSISFSIYIVHFAVRDVLIFADKKIGLSGTLPPALYLALSFAVILAASCMIATLTKRYVEDPGIALGRKLAKRLRGEPVNIAT